MTEWLYNPALTKGEPLSIDKFKFLMIIKTDRWRKVFLIHSSRVSLTKLDGMMDLFTELQKRLKNYWSCAPHGLFPVSTGLRTSDAANNCLACSRSLCNCAQQFLIGKKCTVNNFQHPPSLARKPWALLQIPSIHFLSTITVKRQHLGHGWAGLLRSDLCPEWGAASRQ